MADVGGDAPHSEEELDPPLQPHFKAQLVPFAEGHLDRVLDWGEEFHADLFAKREREEPGRVGKGC